jgi:Transposase DDE domain group 1
MNLPLHDFAQNQTWTVIVALACEITAWMQMLALTGHQARRWEPKRLRLRLLSIAGLLATSGRTRTLHLSACAPWARLALDGLDRLKALAALPAPAG